MKRKISKIIILLGLIIMIFITGCTAQMTSQAAYFDMPCNVSCNSCDNQMICDDICENSGIRIYDYKNKNTVDFNNGKYVCKCY